MRIGIDGGSCINLLVQRERVVSASISDMLARGPSAPSARLGVHDPVAGRRWVPATFELLSGLLLDSGQPLCAVPCRGF